MADTEIVVQAQSNAYQRVQDTFHRRGFQFPQPRIAVLIGRALENSAIYDAVALEEQNVLYGMMTRENDVLPGGAILKDAYTITPSAFNGAGSLAEVYDQDPFSLDYEENTKNLYERQYLKARAAAISGPGNVRGGTARQAFELTALDVEMANNRFREIWGAQMAMADRVNTAVQIATNAEAERWRVQLQAQSQQASTEGQRVSQTLQALEIAERVKENHNRFIPQGAEYLAVPEMWIHEEGQGEGQQGSAQSTFGMNYWR